MVLRLCRHKLAQGYNAEEVPIVAQLPALMDGPAFILTNGFSHCTPGEESCLLSSYGLEQKAKEFA